MTEELDSVLANPARQNMLITVWDEFSSLASLNLLVNGLFECNDILDIGLSPAQWLRRG